jgi:hypothetical protein
MKKTGGMLFEARAASALGAVAVGAAAFGAVAIGAWRYGRSPLRGARSVASPSTSWRSGVCGSGSWWWSIRARKRADKPYGSFRRAAGLVARIQEPRRSGRRATLIWRNAAACTLAIMFLFTASAHFTSTKKDLIAMVPSVFPRPELLVSATGVLEVLGA